MQLQLPQTREIRGIRVLTTQQIAQLYEVSKQVISHNFNYNRHRFTEGKHFITLQGEDLRAFKASQENLDNLKYAHVAYLWTEKGALLHAKSVNTDRAWQAYEFLVDFYFRAKEERKVPVTVETPPNSVPKKKKQELPQMDNPIRILKVLLQVAEDRGLNVCSYPFKCFDSRLHGNVIGIRTGITVEKACYELAWELSHSFIHYDGGDLVKSPLQKDYNEQASRAAEMIIKILNVKISQP